MLNAIFSCELNGEIIIIHLSNVSRASENLCVCVWAPGILAILLCTHPIGDEMEPMQVIMTLFSKYNRI